jgi:hypothetical protein
MSSNPRISWPNNRTGTKPPNSKYGAITGVATTHAPNSYNRKNPQTLEQYQQGKQNVRLSRIASGPLANMMSRLSLGKGGKSRRRHTKKHRKTRKN